MTAEIVPIGAVAATTGNNGNSGNNADGTTDNPRLALLMAPGTETDHRLTNVAKQTAMSVLVTMLREHDDKAAAPEAAVRALLLAAAELRWDFTIEGRGLLLSTMMMAGLDELHDDLVTPPTTDHAAQRARLTAAARAGWRRGEEAARTGEPLRVPATMVEPVREMLRAFAPAPRTDDDTPPPLWVLGSRSSDTGDRGATHSQPRTLLRGS